MHVIVPLEGRFVLKDGQPASRYITYEQFWKGYGYLDVFESVTILARFFPEEDPDAKPATGPGVRLVPVPGYLGPEQYLRKRGEVKRAIREACVPDAAYLLRVPGVIGSHVWKELRRRKQPYAVEVVGDPYDVLAAGSLKHPLRPFLRWWAPRELRKQCREAMAALYVTKEALQKRYPCPNESVGVSDVFIPPEAFVDAPRPAKPAGGPRTLIMVGHMNQLYKAPHVLVDALAMCRKQGLDLHVKFVGEGVLMPWVKERAAAAGVADYVEFTGGLPTGAPIRAALDQADLFVLPSFQEGLPRAVVEAMARALPCIGSTVGGFSELLAGEDLVQAGDTAGLAAKISEVITDPARMQRMSTRNLERALEYRPDVLRTRRLEFFRHVRSETEKWQAAQRPSAARG
jgi:glycosyltransferase involved in cell wall biosynthesis